MAAENLPSLLYSVAVRLEHSVVAAVLVGAAAEQVAQLASGQDGIGPGGEESHVLVAGTSLEVERRMACPETLGQVETHADQNADLAADHRSREKQVAGIGDVEVGPAAAAEAEAEAEAEAGAVIAVIVAVAEVVPGPAPEASMQESAVWHSISCCLVSECRA